MWVLKTQELARQGVPDLLLCVRGRFVAVELKSKKTGYKVTPLQEHNLMRIRECGGLSFVVTEENKDWFFEQLERTLEWDKLLT